MTKAKEEEKSDVELLAPIRHFNDVEGVVKAARAIKRQNGEYGDLGRILLQSVKDQDKLIARLTREGLWD